MTNKDEFWEKLYFNIKYCEKMLEVIRAKKSKKSILARVYDFSYFFVIQISFIGAGMLILKPSLFSTVGFFICLTIGAVFLAKVKADSEHLRDFKKSLREWGSGE